MATGVDAVELVLKTLFECEEYLNAEGKEIDIKELREVTNKYIEENQISEKVSQIINEALNLFEEYKKILKIKLFLIQKIIIIYPLLII